MLQEEGTVYAKASLPLWKQQQRRRGSICLLRFCQGESQGCKRKKPDPERKVWLKGLLLQESNHCCLSSYSGEKYDKSIPRLSEPDNTGNDQK